jgi:hypothetical protein
VVTSAEAASRRELAWSFPVFFQRLGRLGSIAMSVVVTLILLTVYHVI